MVTKEKPRICLISIAAYHYFNQDAVTQGGGAQRQMYLLSKELKSSFDVHFIVGDYGQSRHETRDGITLHRAYTPGSDSGLFKQTKRMLVLFDTLRRVDADFYIFRGFPHKAGLLNLWFEIRGKPWLYSFSSDHNLGRHLEQQPKPLSLLFKRAISRADAIVSQTQYQADNVAETFDVVSRIIPNGYPPVASTEQQTERGFFLWVGNINEDIKRPHLYLDIAERTPRSEFVMIGPRTSDDDYHKRIVERSRRLDNVDYLGPVNPDKIHSYFQQAIALLNTSPKEGFPNTFLEAWRYGTPVLSLDVDPQRFVEFPDANGYMSGNIDQLADAVERIKDDNEYWKTLSAPAQEYFEAHFVLEHVASQYEQIIWESLRE